MSIKAQTSTHRVGMYRGTGGRIQGADMLDPSSRPIKCGGSTSRWRIRVCHAPIAPLRASPIAPGFKKSAVRFLFRKKEVGHEFTVELSELGKET